MEVFRCQQGSEEWRAARLGIPTASEFHAILAKGEGKTRRKYMMTLIGELMTGEPSEGFTNGHTERGKEMEAEARDLYSFHRDVEPELVGFIRNGTKGASPDALVGSPGLLEIKTKLPHIQAEVLLANKLPSEHIAQCQGAIWVAEREWLDFVSYWPRMPIFIHRVYRDEAYIRILSSEVDRFVAEMHTLLAVLRNDPLKVVA